MGAIEAGCKLYPPYNAVREAKEQCISNIRDILSVTGYLASVNLQNLLNHTAACLVNLQKDWLLQKPNKKIFLLRHKTGFDGAISQSNYKQSSNENLRQNLSHLHCSFRIIGI